MAEIINIIGSIQNKIEAVSEEIPLSIPNEPKPDFVVDQEYLTEKYLTPKTSFSPFWLNQFQEYVANYA